MKTTWGIVLSKSGHHIVWVKCGRTYPNWTSGPCDLNTAQGIVEALRDEDYAQLWTFDIQSDVEPLIKNLLLPLLKEYVKEQP